MTSIDWLERVVIDWTDFDTAGRISQEIAQQLATDRTLLRRLVLAARSDDTLRPLAEHHDVLGYIVLHDALERGLRLRLNRFPRGPIDTPHNHRFSFSSALIQGSYAHTLFHLTPADVGQTPWTLVQPPGTRGELPEMSIGDLVPAMETVQAAGSAYTLHHSTIHRTAMPDEGAYSVFCRGPAQKPCALQLTPASRTYRWKFGRENEAVDLTASNAMTTVEFDRFVLDLEENGII